MTDWWADSASWASAIGTIGATVSALYIALRSWRDAAAERADRDAAQARQVVINYLKSAVVEVTNFSISPILFLLVRDVWRLNDDHTQVAERYRARVQGADARRAKLLLAPQETIRIDITSSTGSPPLPGAYALTIRFTDAAGLDWERTGNEPPRRLVNSQ